MGAVLYRRDSRIGCQVFGRDGLGPSQFSDTKPRRRFQAHEIGFLDGYICLGDGKLHIHSHCHGEAEVERDTGHAVPSIRNYEGG
jgi:hypothetical protein